MYQIEREKDEVNLMNPLTWAYVGDAVLELYIRTELVNKWPLGQAAKTPPSQGGIMGSIPVGVTKIGWKN